MTPQDDIIAKEEESEESVNKEEDSSIVEVKSNRCKSIAWGVTIITILLAAGLSLRFSLGQGKA